MILEIPKTYRKIHVINTSGSTFAEQTKIFEVPVAPPGPGQVLVKVEFSGVEASDILMNAGAYGPLAEAAPEPEVNGQVQLGDCGAEGVGVIVAVGDGVDLKIGDSVLFAGFGISYREYVTCPATQVFPLEMPASAARPWLCELQGPGGRLRGAEVYAYRSKCWKSLRVFLTILRTADPRRI